VRTRNYIKKFIKLGSQLQAVNLKMTTAKTQETMMRSMKNVTRAMKAMNKAMKPAKLQELMKQFAQLDEQLEFKSEMMGDAIDDAVAEEGDEEEQEEVLSKVFDELGFQFDREVPNAPTKDIAAPQAVGSAVRSEFCFYSLGCHVTFVSLFPRRSLLFGCRQRILDSLWQWQAVTLTTWRLDSTTSRSNARPLSLFSNLLVLLFHNLVGESRPSQRKVLSRLVNER